MKMQFSPVRPAEAYHRYAFTLMMLAMAFLFVAAVITVSQVMQHETVQGAIQSNENLLHATAP